MSKIQQFRDLFERSLANKIGLLDQENPLQKAFEYALCGSAGRVRPLIVFSVAEALGFGLDVSDSALSIEYFHTASLVADDLPSMDDDDMRRSKPALHKVFGESMALLTSYALISAGYQAIAENGDVFRLSRKDATDLDLRLMEALKCAAHNGGLHGATGGQFLDLCPPNLSLNCIKDIIKKKTGSLFEIAFVSGWIFGGGELSALPLVKKVAHHFGLFFQIVDDFHDCDTDKAQERKINFVNLLGEADSLKILEQEKKAFFAGLSELGINLDLFEELLPRLPLLPSKLK